MFYYQCDGGGCVHYDDICDSFADCPDGDDEFDCTSNIKFPYFNIDMITGSLSLICVILHQEICLCVGTNSSATIPQQYVIKIIAEE